MKEPYHIVSREAETAAASLAEFAKANGQILLPLVGLITQARLAVEDVSHLVITSAAPAA